MDRKGRKLCFNGFYHFHFFLTVNVNILVKMTETRKKNFQVAGVIMSTPARWRCVYTVA